MIISMAPVSRSRFTSYAALDVLTAAALQGHQHGMIVCLRSSERIRKASVGQLRVSEVNRRRAHAAQRAPTKSEDSDRRGEQAHPNPRGVKTRAY